MASSQFLIRSRHQTTWYSRVIIPTCLRDSFNGKRELRRSLGTSDKAVAKRQSLAFWLQCQDAFERLKHKTADAYFQNTDQFMAWLSENMHQQADTNLMKYIETTDVLGNKHVINLDGDLEGERALALQLHKDARELLQSFKDNPKVLRDLLNCRDRFFPSDEPAPETPISCSKAIDLYIEKLKSQGRKGKKLAQRTLLNYQGRLEFWKVHFSEQPIHEITLTEIADIQSWLTKLPVNFSKQGVGVQAAIWKAQSSESEHKVISDKTRAEYLGQLKGLFEYAFSSGFIKSNVAQHIEIPNAKQNKTIVRLPFSNEDLEKVFPGDSYGKGFATRASSIDPAAKYWFPLIAAFSGARLEEIAQLTPSDIKTCPETNIIYMDISNDGVAGDGAKKNLKNQNSVRPIPIHSTLIDMGFLDFVEERESNGQLFNLKRDKQGRLARTLSAWFSRNDKRKDGSSIKGYIEKCGVASKGENEAGQRWMKSFHSFRHAVIDNLRDNKKLPNGEYIMENHIGLVMGHTGQKLETAKYGANRNQLSLRKDVIEAIKYPSLDTNNIRWG
jgi:site-specific recombinase XerD